MRTILPTEPYYITVAGQCGAGELQRELERLAEQTIDPLKLLDEAEAPFLGKYDEFVAPDLLRKAFVVDGLDLDFFNHIKY